MADVNEWWDKHEAIIKLQGYESSRSRFEWQLLYKPEHRYLDDYMLGTTCWYISLAVAGGRFLCAANTPEEAIKKALTQCLEEIDDTVRFMISNPTHYATLDKEDLLSLKNKLIEIQGHF